RHLHLAARPGAGAGHGAGGRTRRARANRRPPSAGRPGTLTSGPFVLLVRGQGQADRPGLKILNPLEVRRTWRPPPPAPAPPPKGPDARLEGPRDRVPRLRLHGAGHGYRDRPVQLRRREAVGVAGGARGRPAVHRGAVRPVPAARRPLDGLAPRVALTTVTQSRSSSPAHSSFVVLLASQSATTWGVPLSPARCAAGAAGGGRSRAGAEAPASRTTKAGE